MAQLLNLKFFLYLCWLGVGSSPLKASRRNVGSHTRSRRKKIKIPFWELFLLSLKKNNHLRVVAKKILRDFWEIHGDCEQQLKSWFQEASTAQWRNPNEIKLDYPSASILNDNRIVFNIKGNNYRLIVKVTYEYQMIWIRFIGTHAEYDKINANEI